MAAFYYFLFECLQQRVENKSNYKYKQHSFSFAFQVCNKLLHVKIELNHAKAIFFYSEYIWKWKEIELIIIESVHSFFCIFDISSVSAKDLKTPANSLLFIFICRHTRVYIHITLIINLNKCKHDVVISHNASV